MLLYYDEHCVLPKTNEFRAQINTRRAVDVRNKLHLILHNFLINSQAYRIHQLAATTILYKLISEVDKSRTCDITIHKYGQNSLRTNIRYGSENDFNKVYQSSRSGLREVKISTGDKMILGNGESKYKASQAPRYPFFTAPFS